MLPEITLDDEQYGDIIAEALNTVAGMYPEWTDFNEHDPGITMVELFAAMKESQQYFIDQIGRQNREKYLKLLGLQRRRKCAAKSCVQMKTERDLCLLHTQKLGSGSLCFETMWQKQLVAGDIGVCLSVSDHGGTERLGREQMEPGYRLHFYPFGQTLEQGAAFYVGFENELPVNRNLELYTEVSKDYDIPRNPLSDRDFIPLAKIKWQYSTARGWIDLEEVEDETYAFLFDGFIRFRIHEPMERTGVAGKKAFYIRVVLIDQEYDVVPVLTRISMNVCEVVQRDTLVECMRIADTDGELEMDTELSVTGSSEVYLGKDGVYVPAAEFEKQILQEKGMVRFTIRDERLSEADDCLVINRDLSLMHKTVAGNADGFPNHQVDMEDRQVEWESFEIMVEDPGDGCCRLWQKVQDFSMSSAEDRHYVFDSVNGVIRFGDCIHGMAPEGRILLAGYVRTMGSDGNVKAGKIRGFRMAGMEEIEVTNICGGHGGMDEETLDDCFLRAADGLKESGCAVTADDYERYVKETPGLMIESCKVLHLDNIKQFARKVNESDVYLVVKPYGWTKEDRAGWRYCRNIKWYLENHRMIGSNVFIYLPEYADIDVHVELEVRPQYYQIEERVREKVREFFAAYQGAFGALIRTSDLYGFMGRQEFVRGVRSLSIDARGSNVRHTADGDIRLAPNTLALLHDVQSTFMIG